MWKPRKETSWISVRRYESDDREVLCPQCARPMADMGKDFRAPKKTEIEAWEVLAFLYDRGFSFHGCGCDAGGYIPPRKRRHIPAFLKMHHSGRFAGRNRVNAPVPRREELQFRPNRYF